MKISIRKFKQTLLLTLPVCFWACTAPINEDLDPCESYLEFVYDYNMEFVCSFRTHVETVDVLFFDPAGVYRFTHTAHCATQLSGGNRLALSGVVDYGRYRVLAIGGLTNYFNLSDFNERALVPGQTTIDEVQLALKRTANPVVHEFSPVWGSLQPVDIVFDPQSSGRVWQVPLLKYTNRYHISMTYPAPSSIMIIPDAEIPYTFEIVTPEEAVYASLDNAPRTFGSLSYTPYTYAVGTNQETLMAAKANSVRLFDDPALSYRFLVRNGETGAVAWEYDLIQLLEKTKPHSATGLSTQEYLDRESEWNIVILHYIIQPDGAIIVLGIKVNSWILWLNDIEM